MFYFGKKLKYILHGLVKMFDLAPSCIIPMDTNSATLVADLFLICYERDFMMSLSADKQADIIDAFKTTSRYLDDILYINYVYFDSMVRRAPT